MASRRASKQWWSSLPWFVYAGLELVVGFMLVSFVAKSARPLLPALEIIVGAAVVYGFFHSRGTLNLVADYPWLQHLFDRYAPPIRASHPPISDPFRPTGAPSPVKFPAFPKPPDISDFVGLEAVTTKLKDIAGTEWIRSGTLLPGILIMLIGPRGTGKSDVAHAWAAGLNKAGARKSKQLGRISRKEVPVLFSVDGRRDKSLQTVQEIAEASLDGVLLVDDIECFVRTPELGEVLLDIAQTHPKRLLIVASGSPSAVSKLDPDKRWRSKFYDVIVEFPPLNADAQYQIFCRLIGGKCQKTIDRDVDIAFRNRIREIPPEEFENAITIMGLVDRVAAIVGNRPNVTRADLK